LSAVNFILGSGVGERHIFPEIDDQLGTMLEQIAAG
jgi:hypothetical protein